MGWAGCKDDPPPPSADEVNARLERLAAEAEPEPKPPPVVEDAGVVDAGPRKRERVPRPLAPRRAAVPTEQAAGVQAPCTKLVNAVCRLLTESSEECNEARARLKRPRGVNDQRCEETLEWYDEHVEQAKRARPCRLAAKERCRHFGAESSKCASAKRDAKLMRKHLVHACKADLLLFRGFGN